MDEEKKEPEKRPARDTNDATATALEAEAWREDRADINDGTATTASASELADENDAYADLVETAALDQDEQALDAIETHLETELEVTQADEAGIEGSVKTLDFEEPEGGDSVDPQKTRPDVESRDPDEI